MSNDGNGPAVSMDHGIKHTEGRVLYERVCTTQGSSTVQSLDRPPFNHFTTQYNTHTLRNILGARFPPMAGLSGS
jgi:hypothetical protein